MKVNYITLPLLAIFLSVLTANSQESSLYEANNNFTTLFGQDASDALFSVAQSEIENQGTALSEFRHALYSKALNDAVAEQLLQEQLTLGNTAYADLLTTIALADAYFENEAYDKALDLYLQLDRELIAEALHPSIDFKTGYLHLVNKQFDQAVPLLIQVSESGDDTLKEHAEYYLGVCYFFNGDIANATSSFETIQNTSTYRDHVPYCLTQLYFSNGDYDKVIQYGTNAVNRGQIENKEEILKLIGQAHYKKGDYATALHFLTKYEEGTEKLSKEEFFQLGHTYYEAGNYDEAIRLLSEIKDVDGSIGTDANYLLAASYLKIGDKQSALAAIKLLMNKVEGTEMYHALAFNYGKLSYETGNDRTAIKTFANVSSQSPHYQASHDILGDILLRTNDYQTAMNTIEGIKNPSVKLQDAYNHLAFDHSMKLIRDNRLEESKIYLQKLGTSTTRSSKELEAKYWLAWIAFQKGQHTECETLLNEYFVGSNGTTSLSNFSANYLMAYTLIERKNIAQAVQYFYEAKRLYNPSVDEKSRIEDVYLRLADGHFFLNEYSDAAEHYNYPFSLNENREYAHFQNGNVLFAEGKNYESIMSLEEFSDRYKASVYLDDALFSIGDQYQKVGKSIEALYVYQEIIENHSNSKYTTKAKLRSALISYNKGDLKTAISYYQSVLQSNPTGNEKKEALKALQEIYVEDLDDPQGYFELAKQEGDLDISDFAMDSISYTVAKQKYNTGKYREAIIAFDSYQRNYSKGYFLDEAIYERAESYSLIKDYDSALKDYILLINDKTGQYYQESTKKSALIAFHHQQDYASAKEYFTAALKLELLQEEQIEFSNALLSCYVHLAMHESTINLSNQMKQDLELNDDLLSRIHYYQGKAEYHLNQKDAAIKSFTQLTRLNNNIQAAEASYLIAEILYQMNNFDSAENQATQTTQSAANYPYWVAKSLLLLSKIYIEKDDMLNARAAAEVVKENYKEDGSLTQESQEILNKIDELEKDNNRILDTNNSEFLQLNNSNTKENK